MIFCNINFVGLKRHVHCALIRMNMVLYFKHSNIQSQSLYHGEYVYVQDLAVCASCPTSQSKNLR